MAEKKYWFLKMPENFFKDNKALKKIRKLPGGDTYALIYMELLLESLRNGGRIYYDGVGEDIAEDLALEINEDEDAVSLTLNLLKKYGLAEERKDQIFLPEVPMMCKSEGASAQRMRLLRERSKNVELIDNIDSKQKNASQSDKQVTKSSHCDTDVTDTLQECATEYKSIRSIDSKCVYVYNYRLGSEELSEEHYNTLCTKFEKNVVDAVIKRIMDKPYYGCLNIDTISKWCSEVKPKSAAVGKTRDFGFDQREYDFDALEQQLTNY